MDSSELWGDNNTSAQHECVIIKKLYEIPYHTVNTWNEVVNPFLPREFVSLYKIMFSVQFSCTVSVHDKHELGMSNLNLQSTQVTICCYVGAAALVHLRPGGPGLPNRGFKA